MSLANACSPHPCRRVDDNGPSQDPSTISTERCQREKRGWPTERRRGLDTTLAEALLGVQKREVVALRDPDLRLALSGPAPKAKTAADQASRGRGGRRSA